LIFGLCGGPTESLPEGMIVAYTECLSTDVDNRQPFPSLLPQNHGFHRRTSCLVRHPLRSGCPNNVVLLCNDTTRKARSGESRSSRR
jgi:hypothetical protein